MKQTRVERLIDVMNRCDLSGMIVTDMKNVRYFTNFSGSDGALVIGKDGGIFLTDGRYTTQSKKEVTAFSVVEYRGKLQGIVDAVADLRLEKLGVERTMMLSLFEALTENLSGAKLVPMKEDITALRMLKDENELLLIREAIRISEESLKEVERLIKPGTTEMDISVELEYAMKKRGSGPLPFPIIVAAGENGALPHAQPGMKKIEKGDLVTVDFGAQYRGYHSDETVTYQVGPTDEKKREIYEIVLEAQRAGIAAVRPGTSVKDLDERVRASIRERGYGDYYPHGTGHGVGLDVHEPPRVSFLGEEVLEAGMVLTVEPGIYIPDWGGIRLEDMVLVTETGGCVLTTVSKSFSVVP